jgi:hypothetical protein
MRPPLVKEIRVRLRAGETFTIAFVPPFESPAIVCRPDRYEELEPEFVGQETRQDPEYGGYSLGVDMEALVNDCEIVQPSDERPS